MKKLTWLGAVLAIAAIGVVGYHIYQELFSPNVAEQQLILIPTGSTFDDVKEILLDKHVLKDEESFDWVAGQMKYKSRVKPGRYLIKAGMSNKQIVALLRSGEQVPVNVSLDNIHTKRELAQRVSAVIEAPEDSLLRILNDSAFAKKLGYTKENILSFIIPDTYQMYWNTSATQFMNKMKREHAKFWTAERKRLAAANGFTQGEVATLGSIVQMETSKDAEKPMIAGVYINRYKKGWPLQADPTVVYAVGDFSLRRVLSGHRETDSPYNTYKYKGLPPGPICLVNKSSLDAVLHYTRHNYMFFCAKDDFSGYHAFAVTGKEQMANAAKYHAALNRRGIR